MAKIVSFINYKGGVAKTTTTYHIGCCLAYYHNKRVLLVDIDPQTNLTTLCAPPDRWKDFKDKNGTIANLIKAFIDETPFDVKRIIWKSLIEKGGKKVIDKLDLIPSDVELLGVDLELATKTIQTTDLDTLAKYYLAQRSILSNTLQKIQDDYDYILIDCPPNLYLMTQNALVASDKYIIVTIPEYLSISGLGVLLGRIELFTKRLDSISQLLKSSGLLEGETLKIPEWEGVIFTKVRIGGAIITRIHSSTMNRIKNDFPGKCFENYTTEVIGYSEAADDALPLFLSGGPNAQQAAQKKEYEKITEEFLQRIP